MKAIFEFNKGTILSRSGLLISISLLRSIGRAHKLNNIPYLHRLEMVKQLLRPFSGQYVLDAGCGDGRLCYELRKENVQVMGVDMSERAISFAKAFNPDINFLFKI